MPGCPSYVGCETYTREFVSEDLLTVLGYKHSVLGWIKVVFIQLGSSHSTPESLSPSLALFLLSPGFDTRLFPILPHPHSCLLCSAWALTPCSTFLPLWLHACTLHLAQNLIPSMSLQTLRMPLGLWHFMLGQISVRMPFLRCTPLTLYSLVVFQYGNGPNFTLDLSSCS